MNPRRIFINGAGRLRSGWRLLLFTLTYIALLFFFGLSVRMAYALGYQFAPKLTPSTYTQDIIFRTMLLASALIAGLLCTRWLEGLPWRAMGMWPHQGWFRDFFIGSLIGMTSLALAAAIAAAAGGLHFFPDGAMLLQIVKSLTLSAILFVVAALAEEILFRGYPLQTMTRANLAWLGILLTSVPFAAVHLRNPNVVQGFTFINTALAGVWFAVAYLRTRSLWLPLGLHWSWNWMQGSMLGLAVSGITNITQYPALQGKDLGPAWLTGGSYGLEGGAACTVVLIVSAIFIWRTRLLWARDEMRNLTSQENLRLPHPMLSTSTLRNSSRAL